MKTIIMSVSVLAIGVANCSTAQTSTTQNGPAVSLFDGRTLDGWIDQENSAGSYSGGDIKDIQAFAKKLTEKSDAVSAFLYGKLDDKALADLANSPADLNARATRSALVKNLNRIISSGSIYDKARFKGVHLEAETKALLETNPEGWELTRLNKLLLEDAYPAELGKSPGTGWRVKDGVIASTGAGRGTLYTKGDYDHFRLMFQIRHVSGKPDHQACVLIFCTRPEAGEKPLDALGGIQFQVPNGGHWDYRRGHNNGGKGEFTNPIKGKFNIHEWSQIEIVADAGTGAARMAVAQPPGSKAVEVLDFHVPDAGKTGPIALQMHNAGLFDEYRDITIEVNPRTDDLITTK
ncbi:MAG: DUF1080 domain-containing protein [Verrucomicrobiota bacterium]|nr:DUF1080 domain-containing protein [Verrucomicrobiota bacterium]